MLEQLSHTGLKAGNGSHLCSLRHGLYILKPNLDQTGGNQTLKQSELICLSNQGETIHETSNQTHEQCPELSKHLVHHVWLFLDEI